MISDLYNFGKESSSMMSPSYSYSYRLILHLKILNAILNGNTFFFTISDA